MLELRVWENILQLKLSASPSSRQIGFSWETSTDIMLALQRECVRKPRRRLCVLRSHTHSRAMSHEHRETDTAPAPIILFLQA